MWHASVSIQRPGVGPVHQPRRVEAAAIEALAGVGDPDGEWWLWNVKARVGHLRVPVTADEAALIPPGVVTMDAGETGPLRARSAPR